MKARTLKNPLLLIVLSLCMCFVLTSSAEAIVFFDGTFAAGDWTLYTETLFNGGTSTPSQVLAGGNPDAYRRIDHVVAAGAAGSGIWGFHIKDTAVYNPGVLGAISSLNYMEDARAFPGAFGQGQATGPALRQNGKNYFTGTITGPSQDWHNISLPNLSNLNFRTLSDANDHPDFSALGNSMTLGFYRANSTGGTAGYSLDAAIDNWKIDIPDNNPIIPEPATMLLFGSGMAGAFLRRRKA